MKTNFTRGIACLHYCGAYRKLFDLLVSSMLSAKFAELTELELVRILLLILSGSVIPVLAFGAFQCGKLLHLICPIL